MCFIITRCSLKNQDTYFCETLAPCSHFFGLLRVCLRVQDKWMSGACVSIHCNASFRSGYVFVRQVHGAFFSPRMSRFFSREGGFRSGCRSSYGSPDPNALLRSTVFFLISTQTRTSISVRTIWMYRLENRCKSLTSGNHNKFISG